MPKQLWLKCVICKKRINGFGNNAQPLKDGRCCDTCDQTKVIPKRFEMMTGYTVPKDFLAEVEKKANEFRKEHIERHRR